MVTAQERLQSPQRLVNYETARSKHGTKAESMARMLTVGDPLADAVIAELDTLGKDARKALKCGLADGLDSLDRAPPATEALLSQLEAMPDWGSEDTLTNGDQTTLLVPPRWSTLAFACGTLPHAYSSPSIAKLLVQTGQLDKMAARRLAETNLWMINSILPGGLLRGAAGYRQTAEVRLLHARVRATALKHGWQTERWGVPINQVDTARTWLDLTLVPFSFLASAGFVINEGEQQSLYRYWRYIAYLLGLDESFFLDVHDHATANDLQDLLDSTIAPPDDHARVLVEAAHNAASDNMAGEPTSTLTREAARDLVNALARQYLGDAQADALGIPTSPATPFLPFIEASNAWARRLHLGVPEAAAQERAENAEQYRALAATLAADRTAYQEHLEAAS
ncbi:DUF2236 domain-containing protein [Streptomyces platensis]|uniref:oxygenase MpaB family protein n=1 Tax=Streptomyces platensis TaxID=58346 RepID=UPI002ED326B9|nr:DUF2236 domain-containing protein [Streptomyces platensis]